MSVIRKINTGLYNVERGLAVISFIGMMSIMFIQVFFRYVVHSSLAWSEETMRFLFIFTSYFGAACCTYEHKHVVIDFLGTIVRKLQKDEKKQELIFRSVDILVSAVCTAFFLYISNVMFEYAATLKSQHSLSSAMAMPMHWLGYAVAAAFFLNAVHYFIEIFLSIDSVKYLKKGEA